MLQSGLHPGLMVTHTLHGIGKKMQKGMREILLLTFKSLLSKCMTEILFPLPLMHIALADPGKASHYSNCPQSSLLCQVDQKKLLYSI